MVKNSPANEGDIRNMSLILGSEIFPGGSHGNSVQYSCLENSTDRGGWQAIIHKVTKSQISLKQLSTQAFCLLVLERFCFYRSSNILIDFLFCF